MRYLWQDPDRPAVVRRSAGSAAASIAAALTIVVLIAGFLAMPGCGGGAG